MAARRSASVAEIDLGRVIDPREVPTYAIPEASHYLQIPAATLRSWVVGRPYPTSTGAKESKPLIQSAEGGRSSLLTFFNLLEAHVLDSIRRHHKVPMQRVRAALDFLAERLPSPHPLLDQTFKTDGLDLFIENFSDLMAISAGGQLGMKKVLQAYLERIEHDEDGVAVRLYPFTRLRTLAEPRLVMIDAQIAFGRPALADTNIATAIVAERYKAGESIERLARDYGRKRSEIEEAIRCELRVAA